jgi:glucose-1-phosphate adenylyltransferase
MQRQVVAFVLAGGRGTRLFPLTKHRAKPAVPFGGKYRIIDFVLSNLINSGIYAIYVLVQFENQGLLRHLRSGWQFSGLLKDHFIFPVPAQMRLGDEEGYSGTANAIYQNLDLLDVVEDQIVAVFGADHIYRMNVRNMIDFHSDKQAQVTVAAIPVPSGQAAEFGVLEVAADGAILDFHEKNADAPKMPGDPTNVFASMGNYLFSTGTLMRELKADAVRPNSKHDFGRDILPSLVGRIPMYAYDFRQNRLPGEEVGSAPYWRDVGTLDAYYEAQMDLCGLIPALNLHNPRWPIRTETDCDPGAKLTYDEEGRPAVAEGSVISGGCILSGGLIRNSILGRAVRIGSGALVEDAVILGNAAIGRRSKIRRTIIDENVTVLDDALIGYDLEADRQNHHVTESGIVVVSAPS